MAQVRHEAAVAHGEVIEFDSDDEGGVLGAPTPSIDETIQLCLSHLGKSPLELTHELRHYRADLMRMHFHHSKQQRLDSMRSAKQGGSEGNVK